jgi:fibronectin-binding autotransporter adhesin
MIEPLESRIAPAATITFIDLDGDVVKITSSKGTLDQLQAAAGNLDDHALQTLNLSATADFDGATISITATPKAGKGDGFVNVGRINATGRVLGAVTVDGDLGEIQAGNTAVNAVALGTLKVHSMGLFGTSTGASSGLASAFAGSVKSITVGGDVSDASVKITGLVGTVRSSLGALTIAGDLRAPASNGSGSFLVDGDIGPVKIGGEMVGGATLFSGSLQSVYGKIGNVTIGGSLTGGTGTLTGAIIGPLGIGNVTVGGDFRGGPGNQADTPGYTGDSGSIRTTQTLASLTIGGSIIGTNRDFSAYVGANRIGNISIGGSVEGNAFSSASIKAELGIGNVTIGRDLHGSFANNTARISTQTGDIGNVTIRGSVIGGSGDNSGDVVALDGNIGNVIVRGKVQGGSGVNAGSILAFDAGTTGEGNMGSVFIGTDLQGGGSSTANYGGTILAYGNMGAVTVGGSLMGGYGLAGGTIYAVGNLKSATVHGGITGYSGTYSGSIISIGELGSVIIDGTVQGGSGNAAGSIVGNARLASVYVGGSVLGGTGTGVKNGHIISNTVGNVTIRGDLVGGEGSGAGSIQAVISIGNVSIGESMKGSARIEIIGIANNTKIGNVTIADSFFGYGSSPAAAGIFGNGQPGEKLGAVKVGGDWDSGQISFGEVASISVEGSLIGGDDPGSPGVGYWHGGKVGAISVGGDIIGGGASETGRIAFTKAASVTIDGSVRGGTADFAGSIGGNIDKIVIGRDLKGGQLFSGGALYAGAISGAAVGSITIGGSLISGVDSSSGTLDLSGAISIQSLGTLTIKGSVTGNSTLAAKIQVGDSIKSISIGGKVELGLVQIYNKGGQLGSLTVAGDWIASDVSVGLGYDSSFGSGNEARSNLGFSTAASKIASITIKGQVLGQVGVNRSFGFGAEEIGAFTVGKGKLPLRSGAHNDLFAASGVTGNALPVGSSTATVVNDFFAVHVFEV